jgi:C4-dicarboxylate-specific signal transduction histidine kinase
MAARERILVVDDAPTVRHLLKLLLEEANYQVETLASAGEAVAAIADQTYDLIIVDKNLDGEDGFAVCRAARDICPDTARILVTADQSVESAIQAVEEDIYSYMTKPLRKQEVLLKVRRALDRVRLTREREEARTELQKAKEDLERRTEELERTLDQLLRTQTRLVESEKLVSVGMLAAGVAHEINNPACFILPNLEYLKRSAVKLRDAARAGGAEEDAVEREVNHINRMVDRCLEGVGRIQKVVGTLQLFSRRDLADSKPVELNAICISLLDLVNHELVGRAKLEVDLRPIPPVSGREQELAQAVLNLLLNARRSIFASTEEKEHTIQLTTEVRGDSVVLSVRDTGPALSTGEDGEESADSFFFVDEQDGQGPGLALRLVQDILDRSGGHLELHGTAEGNLLEAFFTIAAASEPV